MILYILRTVDCWPGRGFLLDPMVQRQFCPISNSQNLSHDFLFNFNDLQRSQPNLQQLQISRHIPSYSFVPLVLPLPGR